MFKNKPGKFSQNSKRKINQVSKTILKHKNLQPSIFSYFSLIIVSLACVLCVANIDKCTITNLIPKRELITHQINKEINK